MLEDKLYARLLYLDIHHLGARRERVFLKLGRNCTTIAAVPRKNREFKISVRKANGDLIHEYTEPNWAATLLTYMAQLDEDSEVIGDLATVAEVEEHKKRAAARIESNA